MGFFDGLSRMMRGEQVFQEGDNDAQVRNDNKPLTPNQPAQPVQDTTKTSVDDRGYKIIPKIEVSNLRTHREDGQMTSTLWITNASDEIIRIDNVHVANQKQVFNRELGPHAGYEFLIYRGPVQPNEAYNKAEIVYRLKRSDDLFQEEYFVEYNRESDSMYTLEEFHQNGPTRDI